MTDKDRGDWLLTRSRRRFYPADPRPADVDLGDIAWGLARACRFAGQTPRHYSVAEHSLLVASLVPMHLQLHGLLHDAAEAYIGDLIRPVKRFLRAHTSAFDELEARVQETILARFSLAALAPADAQVVKTADVAALRLEWAVLMTDPDPSDPVLVEDRRRVLRLTPAEAAFEFTHAFRRYGGRA